MKKIIALALTLICIFCVVGCNNQEEQQHDNKKMQFFFTAKVIETNAEYLSLEVLDKGNSNISVGAKVEVSTDVVSAKGCPDFEKDEYARIVIARNIEENPTNRIEALSIYKTDKTGNIIAD